MYMSLKSSKKPWKATSWLTVDTSGHALYKYFLSANANTTLTSSDLKSYLMNFPFHFVPVDPFEMFTHWASECQSSIWCKHFEVVPLSLALSNAETNSRRLASHPECILAPSYENFGDADDVSHLMVPTLRFSSGSDRGLVIATPLVTSIYKVNLNF